MNDPHIEYAIKGFETQIEKLKQLRESPHDVTYVMATLFDLYGEDGYAWLFQNNASIGCEPIEALLQGKVKMVGDLLNMIDNGVYV